MQAIKPPHIYYEWVELLEAIKEKTDDNAVLNALRQGTVVWEPVIAERLTIALFDSINSRIAEATERFRQDINRAGDQESQIVRALLALRKEMGFLYSVTDLPAIPERERKHYCSLVRKNADDIQKSLEDLAKTDRSGKTASIVRNNRVNVF